MVSTHISVSVFCTESGGEDCGLCLSLPSSHHCGWCSSVGVCTTVNQCKLDPFTSSSQVPIYISLVFQNHYANFRVTKFISRDSGGSKGRGVRLTHFCIIKTILCIFFQLSCTLCSLHLQNWLTGNVSHCSSADTATPQDEDALLGLFIGLSVIACLIVSLILVILVILLKRTAAKNTETRSRNRRRLSGIATLQRKLFGRKNSQTEDPLPVVLLSYKADYDETLPLQGLFYHFATKKSYLQ